MKKLSLLLFFLFSIFSGKSFSQGVLLSQPRLVPEGDKLVIFFDIISKNIADQFYIWVEITTSDGGVIQAKTLTGDVGAKVKAGNNKKIIWSADEDSIYLNEKIIVEVKAEKYLKSFNKGSLIVKSAVLPGWGQTTMSQGKPWWLTGVAIYGTMLCGYLYHNKYLNSYNAYKAEENSLKRANLFNQTQKEINVSTVMIYSAVTAWAANVLWVTFTPTKYQPLQHYKISLFSLPDSYTGGLLLSLRLDF